MAILFAIIAYIIIVVPLGCLVWSYAFRDNSQFERMKASERTRSMAAYAVHYDYQKAGWFDRWRFKGYLKKGDDLL